MDPLNLSLNYAGVTLLLAASGLLSLHWMWQRRYTAVQKELADVSEELFQMAELQVELYRKVAHEISDVEEKLLELAVPAEDPAPPLGRRSQVLTLSGKGLSTREISDKLRMPAGEVELILNLKKFLQGRNAPLPARTPGSAGPRAGAMAAPR